jgi:hypothetical protein
MRYFAFSLIFFMNISPVNAEFYSKEAAQVFLTEYCITLVDEIEKSYQKQKEAVERNRTSDFNKLGRWIYGISEVFANLDCSNQINKHE